MPKYLGARPRFGAIAPLLQRRTALACIFLTMCNHKTRVFAFYDEVVIVTFLLCYTDVVTYVTVGDFTFAVTLLRGHYALLISFLLYHRCC